MTRRRHAGSLGWRRTPNGRRRKEGGMFVWGMVLGIPLGAAGLLALLRWAAPDEADPDRRDILEQDYW